MKKTVALALFVVFAAFVSFAFKMNPEEPAGQKIFIDSKCTTCHSVQSAGIVKGKKDLSDVGNLLTKEQLTGYLTKKDKVNDKLHPMAFKGTDEDLAKLTDWLSSLRTEKK